ncbi:hypothetical protein ACQVP2_07470 [Methylobacterium aquaticum]|uniref:hypothetical protein n=1 Tax=Methylobacterium aquaticum TaxID=270351 RepID=UPI003D164857
MKITPLNQRVSRRGPTTLSAGERANPLPSAHHTPGAGEDDLTGRFSTRLPRAPKPGARSIGA